ncbi:hypothetical protein HYDPIDRAFT_182363 [Hydnomerulius pinastri MD-312]|uniref:DUF6593 domain-containing protein n=1 Tax=Hydnomerulius pinastri MD-312 TaxID=994086 RepID=A0A0C9VYI5_9AGAM|nr:hypothetical protein HYDPIDRAFT_182363 [Hydnomerulius pinastri MD-312]
MNSTTTLVNPVPATPYYFSTNSMKNATIFTRESHPLYTVSTDLKADKHTKISDARTGQLIAAIDRKDILSDTITFPNRSGGASVSVHKWLQKSKLADGYPVHLMETSFGRYVWKSDAKYRVGLYTEDNPVKPLAYLQLASATQNFALVLESAAEPFRDDVIIGFLILEQRLRVADRNISVGGGKFEQKRTVLGHYVQT